MTITVRLTDGTTVSGEWPATIRSARVVDGMSELRDFFDSSLLTVVRHGHVVAIPSNRISYISVPSEDADT